MFSGHPMQPNMNHRQMNYESFLSETVDKHGEVQPPLQKSIFENKIEMNFSMGNQMCFSFFAIGPKSDASKPGNIVSQANLTCFDNKKKKTFLFSNMEAKGHVTHKHFHRMLKVFGYQWKQKEGKEHEDKLVSGNALASWLEILCSIETDTAEGVAEFREHFALDRLIGSDAIEGDSGGVIFRDQVGQITRCLHCCRHGKMEGQHRCDGLGFVSLGHLLVEGTILELKERRKNVNSVQFPFDCERLDFSQSQCFSTLHVEVAVKREGNKNFLNDLSLMREFGTEVKKSETKQISESNFVVTKLFFDHIQQSLKFWELPAIPHKTFWGTPDNVWLPHIQKRVKQIVVFMWAFFLKNNQKYLKMFEGETCDSAALMKLLQDKLDHNKSIGVFVGPSLWKLELIKNGKILGRMGFDLSNLIYVTRYGLMTEEGFDACLMFFSGNRPQVPQNAFVHEEGAALSKSMSLLRLFFVPSLDKAGKWTRLILHSEFSYLYCAESTKKSDQKAYQAFIKKQRKICREHNRPFTINLSSWDNAKAITLMNKSEPARANFKPEMKNFFETHGSNGESIHKKINESAQLQIFNDVLETVAVLGLNPVLINHNDMVSTPVDFNRFKENNWNVNDILRCHLL